MAVVDSSSTVAVVAATVLVVEQLQLNSRSNMGCKSFRESARKRYN